VWFVKPDEAEEQAEALRRRLEARHDLPRLKEHYFYLMWLHLYRGHFEQCLEYCDEGIRLAAEVGALPVQYPTLKALALMRLGRFDAAWASLQQEVADEAHLFGRAFKDWGIGLYLLEVMAHEKATEIFARVVDQARHLRRPWLLSQGQAQRARSLIRSGRRGEEESLSQDLTVTGISLASEVVGELHLYAGELDQALQHTLSACEQARANGRRPDQVSALELQARVLLRLDRPEEVVALADSALQMAEEMNYQPMVWRLRADKAQALAMLGRAEEAAAEYETAAGLIRQLAETIADAELKRGFLSNPEVSSIIAATNQPMRKEQ